jgi:hypothetical protein
MLGPGYSTPKFSSRWRGVALKMTCMRSEKPGSGERGAGGGGGDVHFATEKLSVVILCGDLVGMEWEGMGG